jgi:outer membrane lipoprotein-sorting protein
MIRKLFLAAVIMSAACVSNAQTADEILAKYFEVTGGIDKWKALKSLKMEGKVATPQGDLPLTILKKIPNKSKVTINFQGKEFIPAAYDGETAWVLNPFAGGTSAVKLDAETTKELSDEQFEESFIDYKKKGHVVTLEGKEEIDGVQCFKIKLEKNKNNDKDDATEVYYFDTENYVPIMTKRFIKVGPSKGTEIQTFLSDYQEVEGLMLPFSVENKANGQSMEKFAITKISINENIDDSVFAFPKQ